MCVLKYAALHQSALLGANNFKFLSAQRAAFSRHFPPGAQMQHCYPRTKDGNCTQLAEKLHSGWLGFPCELLSRAQQRSESERSRGDPGKKLNLKNREKYNITYDNGAQLQLFIFYLFCVIANLHFYPLSAIHLYICICTV
jgi:hypothetical protein